MIDFGTAVAAVISVSLIPPVILLAIKAVVGEPDEDDDYYEDSIYDELLEDELPIDDDEFEELENDNASGHIRWDKVNEWERT